MFIYSLLSTIFTTNIKGYLETSVSLLLVLVFRYFSSGGVLVNTINWSSISLWFRILDTNGQALNVSVSGKK